eukprot:SAG31_NODE_3562_length_4121_cov_8.149428_4_plen_60_part_00
MVLRRPEFKTGAPEVLEIIVNVVSQLAVRAPHAVAVPGPAALSPAVAASVRAQQLTLAY